MQCGFTAPIYHTSCHSELYYLLSPSSHPASQQQSGTLPVGPILLEVSINASNVFEWDIWIPCHPGNLLSMTLMRLTQNVTAAIKKLGRHCRATKQKVSILTAPKGDHPHSPPNHPPILPNPFKTKRSDDEEEIASFFLCTTTLLLATLNGALTKTTTFTWSLYDFHYHRPAHVYVPARPRRDGHKLGGRDCWR